MHALRSDADDDQHTVSARARGCGVSQALYPGKVFRAAHDRLESDHGARQGVIEYLHVLKLAAEQSVEKVEPAVAMLLGKPGKWWARQVGEAVAPREKRVIELTELTPSLEAYDGLLEGEVAHVG